VPQGLCQAQNAGAILYLQQHSIVALGNAKCDASIVIKGEQVRILKKEVVLKIFA
jgi:hypothetical protein